MFLVVSGGVQDELGTFFTNHDRWCIGVATGNDRHDRGIGDAQTVNAADPEARVDDGAFVIAHLARADRMERRHGGRLQPFDKFGVGLDLRTGRELASAIGVEGGLVDDLARQPNAGDHGLTVKLGFEIVGLDSGRRPGIGGCQRDGSPALRVDGPYPQREAMIGLDGRALERIGKVQVGGLFQSWHEMQLDVGATRSDRDLMNAPAS